MSQSCRGKHAHGPQTTLYYGLNSAFALGQVLFGRMCLWAAAREPSFLRDPAIVFLSMAGAAACLTLTLTLTEMEYWEPKLNG